MDLFIPGPGSKIFILVKVIFYIYYIYDTEFKIISSFLELPIDFRHCEPFGLHQP